jgi:hypothetical protein
MPFDLLKRHHTVVASAVGYIEIHHVSNETALHDKVLLESYYEFRSKKGSHKDHLYPH